MRFTGRNVLVTGGSRGLGRAIAMAFAKEGAHVTATFVTHAAEAEALAKDFPDQVDAVQLDVTNREDVERVSQAIVRQRGSLDIVVANAAIAEDGFFVMQEPEAIERVVATNLLGTANTCRSAARAMLAKRRGVIVTVSSIAAAHARVGQSAYAAAKAGIVALSKTLAAELAPRGIRINCVLPGLLDCGLGARLDHRAVAKAKEHIPLGRLGKGEEVASAVLFLASDEASYIVGHTLVVDGGLSA